MTNPDTVVEFKVKPSTKGYVVSVTRDGKPWLCKGPWADLDVANMMCRAMIEKTQNLSDRLRDKTNV